MKKKLLAFLSIVFLAGSVAGYGSADSKTLEYSFESCPPVDSSSSSLDGICTNITEGVQGINKTTGDWDYDNDGLAEAFDFDDTQNSQVTFPKTNTFSGLGNFSMSVWYKPDTLGNREVLIHPRNESDLRIEKRADDRVEFEWFDGNSPHRTVSSTVLATDTWYHIVAVWKEGNEVELYVNNTLENSTSINNLPTSRSDENYIGSGSGQFYTDGTIDDVRLFSDQLNGTEVSNLFEYNNITNPTGSTDISLSVLSPNDGETFTSNDVNVEASTNINANVSYSIDGGSEKTLYTQSTSGSTTETFDYGTSHYIVFNATDSDNSSNFQTKNVSFSIEELGSVTVLGDYRFNESSGDLLDYSGESLDFSTNQVSYELDADNNIFDGLAYGFDGSSSYTIRDAPSQWDFWSNNGTVSFRVKTDSEVSNRHIFNYNKNYAIALDDATSGNDAVYPVVYLFGDNTQSTLSTDILPVGQEHTITVNFLQEDDSVKIYVNDTLEAWHNTTDLSDETGNGKAIIGARDNDDDGVPDASFFDGYIDEGRMYDNVLNEEQVSNLYNTGRANGSVDLSLSVKSPLDGSTINSSNASIDASTTTSSNVTYSIDGGSEITLYNNARSGSSFELFKDDTSHYVVFNATDSDNASNFVVKNHSFSVDAFWTDDLNGTAYGGKMYETGINRDAQVVMTPDLVNPFMTDETKHIQHVDVEKVNQDSYKAVSMTEENTQGEEEIHMYNSTNGVDWTHQGIIFTNNGLGLTDEFDRVQRLSFEPWGDDWIGCMEYKDNGEANIAMIRNNGTFENESAWYIDRTDEITTHPNGEAEVRDCGLWADKGNPVDGYDILTPTQAGNTDPDKYFGYGFNGFYDEETALNGGNPILDLESAVGSTDPLFPFNPTYHEKTSTFYGFPTRNPGAGTDAYLIFAKDRNGFGSNWDIKANHVSIPKNITSFNSTRSLEATQVLEGNEVDVYFTLYNRITEEQRIARVSRYRDVVMADDRYSQKYDNLTSSWYYISDNLSKASGTYTVNITGTNVSAEIKTASTESGLSSATYQSVSDGGSFTVDGWHKYNVSSDGGESDFQSLKLESSEDTTPPTSSDNWTDSGFVDKSSVDVELTASDSGSGVANISYRVNGGSWFTESGNSTTVSIYQDGNNTLEYNATDNDGNVEATNTEYVALNSPNLPEVGKGLSSNSTEKLSVATRSFLGFFEYGSNTWVYEPYGPDELYTAAEVGSLGDFNNDNISDVFYSPASGNDYTDLNYGSRDGQIVNVLNNDWSRYGSAGSVVDFDDDGDRDYLFVNKSETFQNNDFMSYIDDSGNLKSTGEYVNNDPKGVADIDGDGLLETVYRDGFYNQVIKYVDSSNDTGTIDLEPNITDVGGIGDIDGDGTLDIATEIEVSDGNYNLGYVSTDGSYTTFDFGVGSVGGLGDVDQDGALEITYSLRKGESFGYGHIGHIDAFGEKNEYNTSVFRNIGVGGVAVTGSTPKFESVKVDWVQGSKKEIRYNYSDEKSSISSIAPVPSGNIDSFDDTSALITGWNSPFDWRAYAENDNSLRGAERDVNFTADTVYNKVENATGVVNETEQAINTTLELDVRGEPTNVTLDTTNPSGLISTVQDGSISTVSEVTGVQRGVWYWTVDNIDTNIYGVQTDNSRNHNLSQQYLFKNKEVDNTGSTSFSRLELDAPSIQGTLINSSTETVSSTANSLENKTFQSKGDFITEKQFENKPTASSVNIGLNFTAQRQFQTDNSISDTFTDVDTGSGIFVNSGCSLNNNTVQDLPSGLSNATYEYECNPGDVGLADITQITDADANNDTHYYFNTTEFNVDTNITQGTELRWQFSEDELNDWDSRQGGSEKVYYNGQENGNITISDGIGTVTLNFETDCCGSSPEKGTHNVSLFYEVGEENTTEVPEDDGGGGGGGADPTDDQETIYFGTDGVTDEGFTVPFGETVTRNLTITNERQAEDTVRISRDSGAICQYVSVESSLGSDNYGSSGTFAMPAATQQLGTTEIKRDARLRFSLPNRTVLDSQGVSDYSCDFSTSSNLGQAEPLTVVASESFSFDAFLEGLFGPDVCRPLLEVPAGSIDSRDEAVDGVVAFTVTTCNAGAGVLVLLVSLVVWRNRDRFL